MSPPKKPSLRDVDQVIRELATPGANSDGTMSSEADVESGSRAAGSVNSSVSKGQRSKVSVKGGAPPATAAPPSTSVLDLRPNTMGSASTATAQQGSQPSMRVAGQMVGPDGAPVQRVPQRVRVEIDDGPTPEEQAAMDAADVRHYLNQVALIIQPVMICIAIVVWWVKVDQMGGLSSVSSLRCGWQRMGGIGAEHSG